MPETLQWAMCTPGTSLAVILSTGGSALDLQSLRDIPDAVVVRAELAKGETAACVTATVRHSVSRSTFRNRALAWARRRGWEITVAPMPEAH